MNFELLTVYDSPFPKERIGRDKDGGYVTIKLPIEYDLLLSAGLSDDSSFEDEWLSRNEDKKCIAFDGTIDKSPSANPNLQWVRKNVGKENNAETDDLTSTIGDHKAIFLKMDIEGNETEWFLQTKLLENVLQMVVEFHRMPYDKTHMEIYEKINSTHKLLHLHGNNCCGTMLHEGVIVPVTFECTYVNKKALPSNLGRNTDPLPSPEDRPNINREQIDLNHPPFRMIP